MSAAVPAKRRITPVMMPAGKKETADEQRLRKITEDGTGDLTAADILLKRVKDSGVADESDDEEFAEDAVSEEEATAAARDIRAALERMTTDVAGVAAKIDRQGVDVNTDEISQFADRVITNAALINLRYKNRLPRSSQVPRELLDKMYREAKSRVRTEQARYTEAIEIVAKRAMLEAEKVRAKRAAFTPEQRRERKAAREAWYAQNRAREEAALAEIESGSDEAKKILMRREYAASVPKLPRGLAEDFDDDDSDSTVVSDDEYSLNSDDEDESEASVDYDVLVDKFNGNLYLVDGSVDAENTYFRIDLMPGEFVIKQLDDGTYWRGFKDSNIDHVQLTAKTLAANETRDTGLLGTRLREWNDFQVYDDDSDESESASQATPMQVNKRIGLRMGDQASTALANLDRVIRAQTRRQTEFLTEKRVFEQLQGFSLDNSDPSTLNAEQLDTYNYLQRYSAEVSREITANLGPAVDAVAAAIQEESGDADVAEFYAGIGEYIRRIAADEVSRTMPAQVGVKMYTDREDRMPLARLIVDHKNAHRKLNELPDEAGIAEMNERLDDAERTYDTLKAALLSNGLSEQQAKAVIQRLYRKEKSNTQNRATIGTSVRALPDKEIAEHERAYKAILAEPPMQNGDKLLKLLNEFNRTHDVLEDVLLARGFTKKQTGNIFDTIYARADRTGYLPLAKVGEPISGSSLSDSARTAQLEYMAATKAKSLADWRSGMFAGPGRADVARENLIAELRRAGHTATEIDAYLAGLNPPEPSMDPRLQAMLANKEIRASIDAYLATMEKSRARPFSLKLSGKAAKRRRNLRAKLIQHLDSTNPRGYVPFSPATAEKADQIIAQLDSDSEYARSAFVGAERQQAAVGAAVPTLRPGRDELTQAVSDFLTVVKTIRADDPSLAQGMRDALSAQRRSAFVRVRQILRAQGHTEREMDEFVARILEQDSPEAAAVERYRRRSSSQLASIQSVIRIGGKVGIETVYAARKIINDMQALIEKMYVSRMETLLGTDARDLGIMGQVLKELMPAGDFVREAGSEQLRLSFGVLPPLPKNIRIITQLNSGQKGGAMLHYMAEDTPGAQAGIAVLGTPPNQTQWLESQFVVPPSIKTVKSFAAGVLPASTSDPQPVQTLLVVYRPVGSAAVRDSRFLAQAVGQSTPLLDIELDPTYTYAVSTRGMLVGARVANSPSGNSIEWVIRFYSGGVVGDAMNGSFAPGPGAAGFPSGEAPFKLSVRAAVTGQFSVTLLSGYQLDGSEPAPTDFTRVAALCVSALLVDVGLNVETQPQFATQLYYANPESARGLVLLSALSPDRLLTVAVVDKTPETGGSTVYRMNSNNSNRLNMVLEARNVVFGAISSGAFGLTIAAVPRPSARDTVIFELVPVNTPQKYSINITQSTTRQTAMQ